MDSAITGSILLGMGSANAGNWTGSFIYNSRYLIKAIDHQIDVNTAQEILINQQTAVIAEQTNRINEMARNSNQSDQKQPRFKTAPDEKVAQPNFKKGGSKK